MNGDNRSYWKAREGQRYAEQQDVRRRSGQQSYGLQEAWLLAKVAERVGSSGVPIRMLDFGMGFGRMARLLAGRHDVDYFGYDISEAMVAPLLRDPPPAVGDLARRILIGENLDEVLEARQFDVVFTVSVLIHNSPAQAHDMIGAMRRALAVGGEIWLIENRPVAFSMQDNLWHNGCWAHDFAFGPAGEMDVDIDLECVPEHGVYRLREPLPGHARKVRVKCAGEEWAEISRREYLEIALPRTEQAVRGLESEIAGIGPDVGAARDDAELYRRAERLAADTLERVAAALPDSSAGSGTALNRMLESLEPLVERLRESDRFRAATEREVSELQAGLLQSRSRTGELQADLSDSQLRIVELQARNDELIDAFQRRSKVFRAIVDPIHRELEAAPTLHAETVRVPSHDGIQFNALRDTRFAHVVEGFQRVCHLMHKEWFGIRSAAGALPGQKMAITSMRSPTRPEIERAVAWMADLGVDRIVVHGFSEAMEAAVKALCAAGMDHISLVWHGAPVMWVHEAERRLFFLAVSLAESGRIRRIHGMRAGTDIVVGARGWAPQLLNLPPCVPGRPRRPAGAPVTAFAPSWNLIHKNLATNVLGAVEVDRIEKVWVLAKDFALPRSLHHKIEVLPKLDQPQILETMRMADVVLNASIVDCHPMVEMEALSVGTPSVRGRLWLDALEDHPYVRLTEVSDPLSVRAVADRVSAVLSVERGELEGMMSDYAQRLRNVSLDRYREFLEL